ncbi:hypothetical protein F511_35267 [Dorcoceras hygrometricum]|uniref:Uncharacterized protein n=1 Tax=Dorcoceras hygrometricum TaxID=472368 RepID=A0A2Z7CCE4_9LAMI|nr:hypothetical protein F511_35267 [Dorcoceras hygrometricum]
MGGRRIHPPHRKQNSGSRKSWKRIPFCATRGRDQCTTLGFSISSKKTRLVLLKFRLRLD